MDLTEVAKRLDEFYNCDLQPDEENKDLSNLNEEDIVCIHLPRSDETIELYAEEINTYLDNCDNGRILDNLEYISTDKYLLRITHSNVVAFHYFRENNYNENAIPVDESELPTGRHFETQIRYKDENIVISIIEGATEFGLWIAKTENYDKWFPPAIEEDLFIEITYANKLDIDECRLLADKFIHELSTQIGIEVCREDRPSIDSDYSYPSEINNLKRRNLLAFSTNALSRELYSLYYKTIESKDNEFTILNHIKVIEFVSQTVSRIQMYNMVRAKLEQRESISPSVHFIEELRRTYDALKLQTNDRDLIKMTINTCCNIDCMEITDSNTLHFLMEAKASGKMQNIKKALRSLADILYDTRNQIAHAKMNYQMKGNECPPEDYSSLIKCLKSISEQCIRWFESQAEGIRYID